MQASHSIILLTSNVTASPREVEMWNKAMIETVNLKLKYTSGHSTVLLLSKLRKLNQGTNEIEFYIRNMRNNVLKTRVRRSILTHKINDAKRQEWIATFAYWL